MKIAVLLFAIVLPAAYSFYVVPNLHHTNAHVPVRSNAIHAPVFKSLGDLFKRLHIATVKRCANTFDEGCINGGENGANSDDDWYNGENTPGKRCVNTFDESCINGGENGANSDDDWLNGGNTPGKRCVNTFDESCINGGENGANSDDDWFNGDNNPGRR